MCIGPSRLAGTVSTPWPTAGSAGDPRSGEILVKGIQKKLQQQQQGEWWRHKVKSNCLINVADGQIGYL